MISYGQFGDYTAGKGTFIDTLIQIAGGVNVASDLEGCPVSAEMVLEQVPDIIVLLRLYGPRRNL